MSLDPGLFLPSLQLNRVHVLAFEWPCFSYADQPEIHPSMLDSYVLGTCDTAEIELAVLTKFSKISKKSMVTASAPETQQPTSTVNPRRTRKVLLVDDNADAADTLGCLLRLMGHEVLVAYSSAEALAATAAFTPDVAVLDIGLQAMNGYELADALRLHLGSAAPAMIALTGYGRASDRLRSNDCGFTAHFVKPANLGELLAKVETIT